MRIGTHDNSPHPPAQVTRKQVSTAIKSAVVIDYKKFRDVIRAEMEAFMKEFAKSGRLDMSEDDEL